MLPEKSKKSNVAAGIWILSMFALLSYIDLSEGGNIWDDGNVVGITILVIHGISLFTALWFYSEAKGYSGLLGLGLGFLYALGLIILLLLRDKHRPEAADIAPPVDATPRHSNYFARLFNGDLPLVITYWVWGALVGGLVFGGTAAIIEYNYAAIVIQPYGALAINMFFWFAIAAGTFIWVGIWRSAGKYRGGGWGIVARVMVALGVISTVATFLPSPNEEPGIAAEVQLLSKSLPTMLDDTTRLDAVEYDSDTLMYFHTITDMRVAEIDVEFFQAAMQESLVNSLCNANDQRGMLKDGIAYAYAYADMDGEYIFDVVIAETDCP